LFDYLDEVLQKDVVGEFEKIYNTSLKTKPDKKDNFTEPYPLSKMVSAYSQMPVGNSVNSSDNNDPALITRLKEISGPKAFNENSYKAGVTVSNVYATAKNNKWNHDQNDPDFARKIVDTYDFDGDGRLNPREFIIMSILNNKNILGSATCNSCYGDVIAKKIDPIFNFIDCNNDGKITAEDMWNSLEGLKRKNANLYNIYTCTIRGKKYRTHAMNDFIIKSMMQFDGVITKDEFRAGILLGYWDRHTDVERINRNNKKKP